MTRKAFALAGMAAARCKHARRGRRHRDTNQSLPTFELISVRERAGCSSSALRSCWQSNPAVPGTTPFTIHIPSVGNDDFGQIFGILVAQVTGQPQANGRAVVCGQILAIHAVGEQCLRMKGVRHIDGVPQYANDARTLTDVRKRHEGDVSRLRAGFNEIEYVTEAHTDPFGDIGPTFLAHVQQYMAFRRQPFQLVESKGHRTGNEPIDLEAPVPKTVRKQALIGSVPRSGAVHGYDF
jgi:hypothetical protein